MAWERTTELRLVICQDRETAQSYVRTHQGPDLILAWAPRWSAVVGHNPATTSFVCLGDWWRDEQCERAYYWLKDRGFKEKYPA